MQTASKEAKNYTLNTICSRYGNSIFCVAPFFGPLLFDNTDSDARDHCANERSKFTPPCPTAPLILTLQGLTNTSLAFLSYLRLSVYMAIVSIAIVISFHLKSQPSQLELRMAKPLGIIFWLLSLSCLALGFGNYIKTVNKYSRRVAIVQTGWKTQTVSRVALNRLVVSEYGGTNWKLPSRLRKKSSWIVWDSRRVKC